MVIGVEDSSLSALLRAQPGFDPAQADARATPGFEGDKEAGRAAIVSVLERLAELQERLHAAGRAESTERRVLLVLQGMDTAGKGGTVRVVAGGMDPQGLDLTAFGRPTDEELAHDFLWRIDRALPGVGRIGMFDRSHYEDVLIGRVRQLAPADEIERRYNAINAFEQNFVASGGLLIKCYLHIDADVQAERLRERLTDPAKYWKYNPGDLDERERWADYQAAYAAAIERCSSAAAPWHVVPAGRTWYRNWAVATLLCEAMESLDLDWPLADFDPEVELACLAASQV